ncbi:ATP-binding protein [Candidatus Poribacteria bacterium]|nr:ATP-binding protein [Candidatus Poribacteria bacterium]
MPAITEFQITNFRQFGKCAVIPLRPITVLIGANNSGKSTILQALTLFQFCFETCLESARNGGNGSKLTLKAKNIGADDIGRLPVSTPADLWCMGRTKVPITLKAKFEGGGELTFKLELRFNLFNIEPACAGIADLDPFLRALQIRLIPIFSGLLPREEFLTAPSLTDRQRSQRHGEIVRNLLYVLKREAPKRFRLLDGLVKRLYPDVQLDVLYDEEIARKSGTAKIDSEYADSVLTVRRDLIVAGSGMHQALQIFSGILQPGNLIVLLDEPDAHLHARLQGGLMRVLTDLTESERIQFIIATHSPQLLNSAPPDSVLVCHQGAVRPFAPSAAHLETLDSLGALDRMELVPLLQTRRVVFVENREDRDLIGMFLQKKYGNLKAEAVLRGVTFLFTYQEPVASGVLDKARVLRDLLKDRFLEGVGGRSSPEFVSVGDRDYRTEAEIRRVEREHSAKAKSHGFGFPFRLKLWKRTEIENYLLDPVAMKASLARALRERGMQADTESLLAELEQELADCIQSQRETILERLAARIQDRDRRLNLTTAMAQSRALLDRQWTRWEDGMGWCDAKKVLAALRNWAQSRKLPAQVFSPAAIVSHMDELPADVESLLEQIKRMSLSSKQRKRAKASP